jgi:phosphate-selective porin OprO/OprP
LGLIVAVVFSCSAPVWAQSKAGSASPVKKKNATLEELLQRVEILEERLRESEAKRDALTTEIEKMKTEIGASRPIPESGTLPERKLTAGQVGEATQPQVGERHPALAEEPPSAEIKDTKVLGGLTAGWDKGFYIRSIDGNFEFRPIGILQADFRGFEEERQFNTDETLSSTFDIRRLRLGFEGFMWKDVGYTLEVNIDEDEVELIYAYLNFGYIPWASLRVGQFKEPFSYETLYPEKFLDFVERANIVTSVSPAEDIGVMVHNLGKPYADIFEYGVGVFNGEGINQNDAENDDFEVAARVGVLPFAHGSEWLKKTKLAANATYAGNQEDASGFRARTAERFELFPRLPVDGERWRWGGDMQWYYGPFSLKAEYIRAEQERIGGLPDLITDGWHVDGTWLITGEEKKLAMESGWELAARYEEIRADAQEPFVSDFVDTLGNPILLEDNTVRTVTIGLNKYFNYNMKFQINYQHDWYDNDILTPTSLVEPGVLEDGDDSIDKVLARLQMFF